jgi:hypothetical protein
MANFFDQFDEPTSAQPPVVGGNFFDQFDGESVPAPAGAGMNFTAGLNEGIYNTLGAPVDLTAGAINLATRGINALTGSEIPAIEDPFGGSRSIARGFGAVGVPDPETVQASTMGERIARGAGQGVGYMMAPETAVRGVAQAAGRTVSPWLEAVAGGSRSAGDLAANAVVGAGAGGGATIAGEVAPESARPMAELAGGLVGGGISGLLAVTPRVAAEGGRMAGQYLQPLTPFGQERIAATALRDAATSPMDVAEALARSGELVPGSRPTTFQQSGDMGLGAVERALAARAPDQFMQRRADQNAARLSALGDIQPQGSPQAVVGVLRQNLADLDRVTSEALEAATTTARERAGAVGGAGVPEGYGSAIRQQLMDAENVARERERALWKAVDPDDNLALPASTIREEAASVKASLPKSAKPMEGEESAIFAAAQRYGDVMPFREVTALRSRTSTAMRQELSQNGRTPVYARLSQLRGAIERQIETAVEGKAAQEAEAVASGAMRQEDTMLAQWEAAFSASAEQWLGDRARSIGASGLAGAGANGAARTAALPPAYGGQGAGRGGSSNVARDQGIQGSDGLLPNFDAGAQERLRAASDATRQRSETFGRGPVGDVLRRSGSEGPFNVPSSAVAERFFRPGARGYEDVQALRQAANTPESMASIRDYAISTLRRTAEQPDGTLDPAKVSTWKSRYSDALRAFPEIDRMLSDPVRAAETMARVAEQRKQALDGYRQGLVGRLLGVDNAEDVTRAIGTVFTSPRPVQTMRQLAEQVRANPEATAGLRKAVADHMARRLVSNTEAATSGKALMKSDQFQTFVRQNEAVLREVLSPDEVSTLKAIADDLQRANRSIASVKLPGGSNTAQDTIALALADKQPTILHRVLSAGVPAAVASVAAGPWVGLTAAIGGTVVQAMRQAGLRNVDDILVDAMLNPERARLLISKAATPREAADISGRLMRSYRRASSLGAVEGIEDGEPEDAVQRIVEALAASMKAPTKPDYQPVLDALTKPRAP